MLSTCNRTELYVGARGRRAASRPRDALARCSAAGPRARAGRLPAARRGAPRCTSSASRPASTRSCPARARSSARCATRAEAGAPGPFLDRLFRQAVQAGRKVRVETAIGEAPASVPSAAAALAQQVFGDLRRPAGAARRRRQDERADGAEPPLARRGVVAVANRTRRARRGARRAARRRGGRPRRRLPTSSRAADVVVASTSAPGFVLSARALPTPCAAGAAGRCCSSTSPFRATSIRRSAQLDGCFVYDIDDLEAVVEQTPRRPPPRGRRGPSALVAEEAERFREWQAALDVVPAIASLRARAEEIRAAELARRKAGSERCPRPSAARSRRSRRRSSTSSCTCRRCGSKEAAAAADGVVYADAVRHLFGLGRGGATA